jgi:preprotein translocase subunit YajC
MKTNDLKKGARVLLENGWYATIEDNAKGNTRIATVEGFVTEIGSIYAHDIVAVLDDTGQTPIEHTSAQHKLRALVEELF